MSRHILPPSTCLAPLPVALVTCRSLAGRDNIITIAWAGIVCSEPPMLSISVRPSRLSHEMLKENGDFVVNLPTAEMVREADWCGMVSGRDHDKFKELGWTALPASQVKAAIIAECPLALECRTRQVLSLGAHDMFIGEILAVQVREGSLDAQGRATAETIQPLGYCPLPKNPSQYYAIGQSLGGYGMSKKKESK